MCVLPILHHPAYCCNNVDALSLVHQCACNLRRLHLVPSRSSRTPPGLSQTPEMLCNDDRFLCACVRVCIGVSFSFPFDVVSGDTNDVICALFRRWKARWRVCDKRQAPSAGIPISSKTWATPDGFLLNTFLRPFLCRRRCGRRAGRVERVDYDWIAKPRLKFKVMIIVRVLKNEGSYCVWRRF